MSRGIPNGQIEKGCEHFSLNAIIHSSLRRLLPQRRRVARQLLRKRTLRHTETEIYHAY